MVVIANLALGPLASAIEPILALIKVFLQVKFLLGPSLVNIFRCTIRIQKLSSPSYIYIGLSVELVFLFLNIVTTITGLRSVQETLNPVLNTNSILKVKLNFERDCVLNLISYTLAVSIFPLVQDLYGPYYYLNQDLLPGFQPSGIKPAEIPNWDKKLPKVILPDHSSDALVGFFHPIKKIKNFFLN